MLTQVKRTHKVRHLFQRYRLSKVAAISNRPSTRDPAKVGYHLKKSLGWEVKRLHGASFVFFPTSCFFFFFLEYVCLCVCEFVCVFTSVKIGDLYQLTHPFIGDAVASGDRNYPN